MVSKWLLAVGVLAMVGITMVFADSQEHLCGWYAQNCPTLWNKRKNATIDGHEYVLCGNPNSNCDDTKVETRLRAVQNWTPSLNQYGHPVPSDEHVDYGCAYYRGSFCPVLTPKRSLMFCDDYSGYVICGVEDAECENPEFQYGGRKCNKKPNPNYFDKKASKREYEAKVKKDEEEKKARLAELAKDPKALAAHNAAEAARAARAAEAKKTRYVGPTSGYNGVYADIIKKNTKTDADSKPTAATPSQPANYDSAFPSLPKREPPASNAGSVSPFSLLPKRDSIPASNASSSQNLNKGTFVEVARRANSNQNGAYSAGYDTPRRERRHSWQ